MALHSSYPYEPWGPFVQSYDLIVSACAAEIALARRIVSGTLVPAWEIGWMFGDGDAGIGSFVNRMNPAIGLIKNQNGYIMTFRPFLSDRTPQIDMSSVVVFNISTKRETHHYRNVTLQRYPGES